MDEQLRRAIRLLYDASREQLRQAEATRDLADRVFQVCSALHDMVPAEPVSLDAFRERGA